MARIRGYMGISVDGCLASADGSIDWLRRYDGVDLGEHGYDRFIAGIRTVVMGRGTYESLVAMGEGWPYAQQRAIIVTSRPIEDPIGPLEVWSDGVDALVPTLRAFDDGDVWIVGGGQLQQAMIKRGALDQLELFIVPELIGGGIQVFPPNGFARSLRLADAAPLAAGMVWLDYRFDETTPPRGADSP